MPDTVLLPLVPGTLPPGACFANEQERLNAFAALLQAILLGQSFFNYGSTKPSVENQGYPWLRTTDGRWYEFSGGWISPRFQTSDFDANIRKLYVGTPTDLLTFDGGTNLPPSDRTGPTWEIDTDFDGRMPIGPGNLPDAGTAIVVATNYGGDQHTLLATELPATIPLVGLMNDWGTGPTTPTNFRILADDAYVDGTINVNTNFSIVGGGQPHTILGPSRGAYFIKPVMTRLYYFVP